MQENRFAQKYFDRAVELLKALAPIPAPSHHEEKRAAFLLDYLKGEGIEAYIDEAKNVIIPYQDDGEGMLDVYAAHTDVVFPDTEPLPMRIEDNIMYCPGSGDDTANVVAMLMFALEIIKNRLPVKRGILFVCNSCEEGLGNLKGTRALFESYAGRIASFTSFDSTLGKGIVTVAVGSERYRIKVKTQGGHAFADFGRKNAIAVLSSFITKLYGQNTGDSSTTYNVGTIQGGTSINSIAQEAECTYEFRSIKPENLSKMRTSLEGFVSAFRAKNNDLTIECIGLRPCGVPVDSSLLQAAADKAYERWGFSKARGMSSTDCNIPLSLGIPAICFGLVSVTGTHTREEFIDINSLKMGLELGWDYIREVSLL